MAIMPRDLYLRVRITAKEKKMLDREAKRLGVSVSEVVRDLIKGLAADRKKNQ